jgi:tRNA-2-methylthio-N6-dimethylallyladenosine synthase
MNRPEPKNPPRTFHVKSFGCQMNVYDGERMAEMLGAQGMTAAEDGANADMVVLNTCHIREKAVDKVYSDIGRLRREDGTRPMIAVAGCVAQAEGSEITRRTKMVDIVVGPQAYHRLPELVEKATRGEEALDTDMPAASKFGALPGRSRQARPTAFLTVQEGCDKFCTYCVVPYTRGAEISRPWDAVLDEAKALVDGGAREITLLGQNVNAWGDGERGLHDLIIALDRLDGLARIRYTTSHPNDMTDGLIAAHRDVEKLMPYLHLPVQSGSDPILKAMNRSHTRDSYLRLHRQGTRRAPRYRAVGGFHRRLSGRDRRGFRGDAEPRARGRLCLCVQLQIFAPPRHSCGRHGRPDRRTRDGRAPPAPPGPAQRRAARLQSAATVAATAAQCSSRRRGGSSTASSIGKSPWLQSVHVVAPRAAKIGDMIDVEIVSAGPNSLAGELMRRKAA